jgi:hypothetical protein
VTAGIGKLGGELMTVYGCTVRQAGPVGDGIVKIKLREQGNQFDAHFIAPDGQEKEMLAIALTALSANLPVFVDLGSTTADTEIHWITVGYH